MEKYVTNEGDVVLKHRLGCQIVYILFTLIILAMACVVLFMVKDGKWTKYLFAGLIAVISVYALFRLSRRIIKERIRNIPTLVITDRSVIVSRKKEEYNEIPFDVIDDFRLHRRIHGSGRDKSTTTYLRIIYKTSDVSTANEKFERMTDIDLTGLNMMSHKLEKLVRERLRLYNERNSM